MITKTDLEFLAKLLAETDGEWSPEFLNELLVRLAENNPRFNRDLFLNYYSNQPKRSRI
tara:strand:+ start:476 stop:652 length:177 start_codon:yes stop_codon:yes gene_type:complete